MSTIFKEDVNTKSKLAPKYKVLLHNDDHNSCEYVVICLMMTVNTLTEQDAVNIMWEAHHSGIALVTTAPLEMAEFYQEQLKNAGLGVTIEPD